MRVTVSAFWFLFSAILLRIALDIAYVTFMNPVFEHEGYGLSLELWRYAESWLWFALSMIFVRPKLERVSDIFFVTLVCGLLAPLTVIYGMDADRPFLALKLTFLAATVVAATRMFIRMPPSLLPKLERGDWVVYAVGTAAIVFLVLWYLRAGVTLVFDFSKLYEFRQANTEASAPGVLAYTNIWTYSILAPFLMALALHDRRYLLLLGLFVVQVFFFTASTHKGVLFYPLLVIASWMFFRERAASAIIPILFVGVIVIGLLSHALMQDTWFGALFTRRIFFVPSQLSFVYAEFFSNNPYIYWSNSTLSGYIEYPYIEGLARTIGNYMGTGSHANNGFISSGFAHAGLAGVIGYSVIVGILLKLIDSITQDTMPLWFSIAVLIVPLRNLLISSDLLTVMLTHGLGLSVLLAYLVRWRFRMAREHQSNWQPD